LSDRLFTAFSQCLPGQVAVLTENMPVPDNAQVVYTTRIPRTPVGDIPLMISSAGMLYGGDRQMWIQTAEKVVYFTKEVYNKNIKGPEVCKLN
jgi:hypothetical protein